MVIISLETQSNLIFAEEAVGSSNVVSLFIDSNVTFTNEERTVLDNIWHLVISALGKLPMA